MIILADLCWYPAVFSSPRNSFEDWAPVDQIYKQPNFKWITIVSVGCYWYRSPGGQFSKKISSYHYMKSHCGDKTILRPSYLHNRISYTGKMTSLYWIRALIMTAIRVDLASSPIGLSLIRGFASGDFRTSAAATVNLSQCEVTLRYRHRVCNLWCNRQWPCGGLLWHLGKFSGKSCLSWYQFAVVRSFWNFAQSMAVSLPFYVQNFKMIGQCRRKSWVKWYLAIFTENFPMNFLQYSSPHYLSKSEGQSNSFNSLRVGQSGWHLRDNIFKCILFFENFF